MISQKEEKLYLLHESSRSNSKSYFYIEVAVEREENYALKISINAMN
jgi:hypothetical protein